MPSSSAEPSCTQVTNKTRFPDLASLVQTGHAAGLNMGWYLAGCACGEASPNFTFSFSFSQEKLAFGRA